ncbi:hypothetical protein AM1_2785 [Acaryochloris marina MBIC11017]|uniref:Uncharacterized protein n=1 Tax=Acaryochloris marina (strain MBIC 11017) TaxID=329726 RepID=B0C9A4_ACAM1|nr:hypothetical protein AM1_2785 [Acaryochloris marina MBIC11017]
MTHFSVVKDQLKEIKDKAIEKNYSQVKMMMGNIKSNRKILLRI